MVLLPVIFIEIIIDIPMVDGQIVVFQYSDLVDKGARKSLSCETMIYAPWEPLETALKDGFGLGVKVIRRFIQY